MEHLCERLRELRGAKSQAEIARLLGVKQQNWARWENGVVFPGAETIHHICVTFHVSADWLLGLDESRTTPNSTTSNQPTTNQPTPNPSANCRDCPILLDFIKRRSGGG